MGVVYEMNIQKKGQRECGECLIESAKSYQSCVLYCIRVDYALQ